MAVEIKMTGMCDLCPCADLELVSSVYYGSDKPAAMWSIKCNKESACKRIIELERCRLSYSLKNGTTVVSTEGVQNGREER